LQTAGAALDQKRILITSQKEFDDGMYSVEIATYGKKLYITALNLKIRRKFIVEVPEDKGIECKKQCT